MRAIAHRLCTIGGLAVFMSMSALADPPVSRYTNPIGGSITMGDPFILRNEDHYYLYGTTATGEGFKCWSSTNLLNWVERGFAYHKRARSWGGKTFWAPEVVQYRDRYWMVYSSQPTTNESFSARVSLAVSERPEGPFTDTHAPLFDNGWSCIDGHIFIDTDGAPYLYFAKVGVIETPTKRYLSGAIYGVKLRSDLSDIDGEPVLCTQADQPWELPEAGRSRCNEGPFVFKRGEVYYMTYSANHYAEPFYGIGYATAQSPLGPWSKSPLNPLVSQRPEIGVSGPGHNCVISSRDGKELYMIYHTHADPTNPSSRRTVNMDRLSVQPDGRLTFTGPTRTPQPFPSGL